jgi:NTE family protein
MLKHILEQEDFSLALTPGFFRFYAHAGVLHAMEECNCLKVCHVTGSSAGALVGAFLASGKLYLYSRFYQWQYHCLLVQG